MQRWQREALIRTMALTTPISDVFELNATWTLPQVLVQRDRRQGAADDRRVELRFTTACRSWLPFCPQASHVERSLL